jgi:uroporphyrinogen decarboxylase
MTPRLLKALALEPVDRVPLWFMRQAGRYLPEYRALRESHPMKACLTTPELAAQITLLPLARFKLDAAILFSDLVVPLMGLGLELEFVEGRGPVLAEPLSVSGIDRLGVPPAQEVVPFVMETLAILRRELEGKNIALLGFAGAPFTLATYALEGGSSRSFERTKLLMYREPAAWARLMGKLEVFLADYLKEQARAGAQALQLFDSWAGVLSPYDYRTFVLPYTQRLIASLKREGLPIIYFSTATGGLLPELAALQADALSLDWRVELAKVWSELGGAIQGNLDPLLLLGPWRELRYQAGELLRQVQGRPGYIFNLGHGLLPSTPIDQVERLIAFVHGDRV